MHINQPHPQPEIQSNLIAKPPPQFGYSIFGDDHPEYTPLGDVRDIFSSNVAN
jgi:hypothetical protein